jgi:hypothetical protein
MHVSKKAKSVLVVAAIGTTLGVGGFAVAAFVQDSTAGGVSAPLRRWSPPP